jgi:hypothetical protein
MENARSVAAALIASAVGGLFACAVAFVSPEFVRGLFVPPPDASLVRYAAAVGMIWGVFLERPVWACRSCLSQQSKSRNS